MWFVGLDVHSETTVVSVRSARGAVVRRAVVPTTATALRRALHVRGRVKIACEASPLAPWIKQVLQTQLREVIVCDRRRTRIAARGTSKSDRFDADRLSECLRTGSVHPVYVPHGSSLELRRYVAHYVRMVGEQRRIWQRLNALFLESARVCPRVNRVSKRVAVRSLPPGASREIARAYVRQLQTISELVASSRSLLIEAAAADPAFVLLQTIPQIGPIRAAILIGIVVTPERFRRRRKFWAYGGLGVIQRVSSEHRIANGEIIRKSRTRGVRLSAAGQPLLKKVLCDIALHASVGQGELRRLFDRHLARGKRPAIARLSLARKIASIIIAVWRTGKPYNPSIIKRRKQVSGRASVSQLGREQVRKATALSVCRPESFRQRRTG